MLEQVRIVLVATTHPGNIGSSARAMKNMGLSELYLVNPKVFPSGEATALASGADDILANATLVDGLKAALADCDLVVGTSARNRSLEWPLINPMQMGELFCCQSKKAKLAIVFGREHAGLTNDELALCHYHVQIPANPEFSSLNLSQAVQVLCYALRTSWLQAMPASMISTVGRATLKDLEGFFDHLETTLNQTGFLDPNHPKRLMHRLRRLYQRALLDKTEINILRGVLSSVQKTQVESSGDSNI